MKKATGELTGAVVVVMCVAILIAFFYFVIWPTIDNNFKSQTACEKAICETRPDDDGMVNCKLCEKGKSCQKFKCRYKG